MAIESINPTTGAKIKSYAEFSHSEVVSILERVQEDFLIWRTTPFKQRSECLANLASILAENKPRFAELMALEMGKPVLQGHSEVEKCVWCCRYYAEHAQTFLKDELITTEAKQSFITFQPLGIILAIMPWNFPFWQAFRAAVPSLMAGNAMVLKHSSNVSGCALAIEDVFKQAGFPTNLFRTLLIESSNVAPVIAHKAIKAITLTGSSKAGSTVAQQAGAQLKKLVLELGGSDPYVVLADADIKKTAQTCASSRMINGGQSCIAAKRFIVEQSVFKEFEQCLVNEMNSYTIGDPLDEDCRLGPLARFDLREELHTQVQKSVEAGAKLLIGGKISPGPGAYYPPTVLSNVQKGTPAFDEELFGPVAAIISAKDERDAIKLANDSPYGLGAAVFTQDLDKGRRIAREELEAGCCFVNSFVKSDPRLPFGGIKQSGYGRELGVFGIREFVNVKTVSIG